MELLEQTMTTTAYISKSNGWAYVITTGMPTDAVQVGQGPTLRAAMRDREATSVQSAGRWPRERDLSIIAQACDDITAEQIDEACGDGETVRTEQARVSLCDGPDGPRLEIAGGHYDSYSEIDVDDVLSDLDVHGLAEDDAINETTIRLTATEQGCRDWRTAAGQAGDLDAVAICDVALGEADEDADVGMTPAEARREVARWIVDERGMRDVDASVTVDCCDDYVID